MAEFTPAASARSPDETVTARAAVHPRRVFDLLASLRVGIVSMVVLAVTCGIATFYESYPDLLVRAVSAKPAPTWLGGETKGLALDSIATLNADLPRA